ncbi:UNVERIFIED_CONTAM: Rps6kb1 [Trichonephila clavipes]
MSLKDWDDLLANKVAPPYKPTLTSNEDASHFDSQYTSKLPLDSSDDSTHCFFVFIKITICANRRIPQGSTKYPTTRRSIRGNFIEGAIWQYTSHVTFASHGKVVNFFSKNLLNTLWLQRVAQDILAISHDTLADIANMDNKIVSILIPLVQLREVSKRSDYFKRNIITTLKIFKSITIRNAKSTTIQDKASNNSIKVLQLQHKYEDYKQKSTLLLRQDLSI